jgi:chromosome segregation ATPase
MEGMASRSDRVTGEAVGLASHRIDRVFAPRRAAQSEPTQATPPVSRRSASQAEGSETELVLRRQLARVMHQLAESQERLADKDDELTTLVEQRVTMAAAFRALVSKHRTAPDEAELALPDPQHELRRELEELQQRFERLAAEHRSTAAQLTVATAATEALIREHRLLHERLDGRGAEGHRRERAEIHASSIAAPDAIGHEDDGELNQDQLRALYGDD